MGSVGINLGVIASFIGAAVFQVLGVAMLPLSKGLTQPVPTLVGALGFLVGIGLMARLVNSGLSLGFLIPVMATIVPLCGIALGILFFGETASASKIAILLVACGLIAFASTM